MGHQRIWAMLTGMLVSASPAMAQLVWDSTESVQVPRLGEQSCLAEFSFYNCGDYPVRVLRIDTGCGCTAAEMDQSVFEPGESGSVRLTYRFGHRRTPSERIVTVRTDDRTSPVQRLKISIRIQDPVRLSATALRWTTSELGQARVCVIELVEPELTGIWVPAVRIGGFDCSFRDLGDRKFEFRALPSGSELAPGTATVPIQLWSATGPAGTINLRLVVERPATSPRFVGPPASSRPPFRRSIRRFSVVHSAERAAAGGRFEEKMDAGSSMAADQAEMPRQQLGRDRRAE